MPESFASTRPGLRVEGEDRADLRDALTSMVVNLPLNGMAHAELELSSVGRGGSGEDADYLFQDLAPGARLQIRMGESSPQTLFDGEVTGIEERYGEGAPRLILLLQDRLHHLARQRQSRAFEAQSPDDIVRAIAGEAGLDADASVSGTSGTWHQLNESDLAFLFRLLGRFDIALRLDQGRLRARAEAADPQPVALDDQDSALRVRLLADLNHQPTRSRVLGFNAGTDEAVDGEADALADPPRGTTAADLLGRLGWPGEEVVPQPFARSRGEADEFARGHFRRQARRFLSGDIRCLGEPALRSGREIELSGVSPRLRGTYQVVHCVHRFDGSSGYETHLKVQRPDWSD